MLLALLLSAAPVCTTQCGLMMATFDCVGLQEMESRALNALKRVWPYDKACAALAGWTVRERSQDRQHCKRRGFWLELDEGGACLDGYTWLSTRTVDVARVPWWADHPLPHELTHVIDAALGSGPVGHCRWTQRGIKRALFEATGYADRTLESCP